MSQLPHWFDPFVAVGQLEKVLRKGNGFTTIRLCINDASIEVEVPEDPTLAAELGEQLERLGDILRQPPPEGQVGFSHRREPPTKNDRQKPLEFGAPSWVQQQLRPGETPKRDGLRWHVDGRYLRGELKEVPTEHAPDWSLDQLRAVEHLYREVAEPWRWFAAQSPTDEASIRELVEPTNNGSEESSASANPTPPNHPEAWKPGVGWVPAEGPMPQPKEKGTARRKTPKKGGLDAS